MYIKLFFWIIALSPNVIFGSYRDERNYHHDDKNYHSRDYDEYRYNEKRYSREEERYDKHYHDDDRHGTNYLDYRRDDRSTHHRYDDCRYHRDDRDYHRRNNYHATKDHNKNDDYVPSARKKRKADFTDEAFHKKTKIENKSAEKSEEKYSFIYNGYTERRGEPKMLEIFCKSCAKPLMMYQKDGPGRLLRCYLDRIHSPKYLKDKQYQDFDTKHSPDLTCENCRKSIGVPMIYVLEKRPAYRMDQKKFYIKEK